MSRKNEKYLRLRSPRPRSISSTMKTVIHLGLVNEKNMEILKYRKFENVENSFTVTENLAMENSTEILNVSQNDCRSSWWSQEVIKDKVTRLLALSSMSWENDLFKGRDKRKMIRPSGTVQDVFRSSRVLWIRWRSCWIRVDKFPRTTFLILLEIQKYLRCQNVESERFCDRIIFMSMFNEQCSSSWSTILDIYSKIVGRFRQRNQWKFEKHSLLCSAQSNLHVLWFDIVEKKRSRRWITSS